LRTITRNDLDNAIRSALDDTRKRGEKLFMELVVDPSALVLREENGRRKGGLSVVLALRPEDHSGRLRAETMSRELDLPRPVYEQVLKQGLVLRKELIIPQGATSLRIVARDDRANLLGSVTVALAAIK